MQALFKNQDKIFYKQDLIKVLKNLGIKQGDILFVHSEIYNFGIPLVTSKELLCIFLDCFFEVIGKEGTLIMPTFTYSFCNGKDYDKLHSKTKVGVLNEFFRLQPGVKRTNDPIFSCAIKGAKEDLFLQDHDSCFGENSVFDILTKNNGKIILFGNENLGITYIHYIEENFRVPYRYFKTFHGDIIDEHGIQKQKNIKYYVRDITKKSKAWPRKYFEILRENDIIKEIQFANAKIASINARDFSKIAILHLKINENYFVV
ncbi:aminoglycoside N(3)-acetyltransferase [Campylobacter peloridis]|uniref:AAC(3) family N-acetyltransferase n=1 Tax=Campylobacter peloridis TaxID=488546 RepID=UPI001C73455E|nr:AAC(3) family N-acetyltransferase [Campylobacter peloridis]MBX2078345.1 aminoglycoside N(3)-acetyltransferase [Campylobacter peloridis]